MVEVDRARAEELGLTLRRVGLEGVLRIEGMDPQLQAVRLMRDSMSFEEASTLVVLNSLVSYKLSSRGEDYWSEFAIYMSRRRGPKSLKEAVKLMLDFLASSRINVALRRSKVARLLKASIIRGLEPAVMPRYTRSLEELAKTIAIGLRSRLSSKTILFAVKMFSYTYRAFYERPIIAPFTLPIPVDSRVAKVSWSSGIVDVEASNWSDVVNSLLSKPSLAQRAWSIVAKASEIPPLHLDSLIWLVGGFIGRGVDKEAAVRETAKALARTTSTTLEEAFKVSQQLIHRYL